MKRPGRCRSSRHIRRREVITLLGGAAAAWPLAARAQQGAMPVIGFLRSQSHGPYMDNLVAAFRRGLGEAGFVEGQNVAAEYRYADNDHDRLRALLAELIRGPVAVLVGDNISMIAAKAATTTVPIVFATGGDPVRAGLVASLNRPGGNVTGVSFFSGELGSKRLELLRQLAPGVTTIAVLVHSDTPTNRTVNDIMASPEGQASLMQIRAESRLGTPQDFAALIAAETRKWSALIKTAGISID